MTRSLSGTAPTGRSPRLARTFATAAVIGLLAGASLDAAADRNVKNNTRTSVNKNTNVNRNTNVNVDKNVNVNTSRHVDVDVDVDHGWHPVATVAAVAVTAAVVGSVVNSLPPSGCYPVQIGPTLYQQCGSYWYQPQYYGTTVQYVVVNPPR
jgi:hypothetical protein